MMHLHIKILIHLILILELHNCVQNSEELELELSLENKSFAANDFENLFGKFKEEYGKSYASQGEEEARKSNFIKSLLKVWENEKLFSNNKVSYELSINQFADLVSPVLK